MTRINTNKTNGGLLTTFVKAVLFLSVFCHRGKEKKELKEKRFKN